MNCHIKTNRPEAWWYFFLGIPRRHDAYNLLAMWFEGRSLIEEKEERVGVRRKK